MNILLAGGPIYCTVLAQEMHGSSQSGSGSSIPAVITSHPGIACGACDSYCEPRFVSWP
jgi:hypothetical protein